MLQALFLKKLFIYVIRSKYLYNEYEYLILFNWTSDFGIYFVFVIK